MNGAESLVKALLAGGVDVTFTNPGTSEMHYVAALDAHPQMRCALCLFEGVATGAADGYARMADKPAATLLHLGPGLGNGLANLHNARRASSPLVNIVGDHATYHVQYDAPLTSDIAAIAKPVSDWVESADSAAAVASLGSAAITAARTPPGQIATLILPADTAWNDSGITAPIAPAAAAPAATAVAADRVERIASLLRSGEPCLLLLGGHTLRDGPLQTAARIAAASGAELLTPVSNARLSRGAGRPSLQRLPYPVDAALTRLSSIKHLILVDAKDPVAFFAYPDKPSRLMPPGSELHTLAAPGEDAVAALDDLSQALGAGTAVPVLQQLEAVAVPDGALTPESLALAVAAEMPEQAIVVDESITCGRAFFQFINGVAAHDWLQVTGGAIGIGPPLALGAALACPDRPVIALQADGSALYTSQALWSQARESLNVTTVILSNRAYAILQGEMRNVGAKPGKGTAVRDLFELDRPPVDWPALARGYGVPGEVVEDTAALRAALRRALAEPGPYLIEARL